MSTHYLLQSAADDANRAAHRLEQAARSANEAADRMESVLYNMRVLTDSGYGNNVERFIETARSLQQEVKPCCANENRSMACGCLSCGDPAL